MVVDMAQSLAALKIHIDELERGGRPRPRNDIVPSYKPKSVLPPSIVKGKDLKTVQARVAEEYSKISHLCVRDAKHAYLETAAVASSFGCDNFFPVKEIVLDKGKRVPRLMGVGKYHLIVLDEKTKQLVHRDPLSLLRRWETVAVRGLDLIMSGGPSLMLTFSSSVMTVQGEDAVLRSLSDALLKRTGELSKLPLEDRLPPRDDEDDVDLDLFEPECTPVNTPPSSPNRTPRASPPSMRRSDHRGVVCNCPPWPVWG